MARLTGQALHEDILNTIVEDSEPERAALEATQKEERKKRRAEKKRRKEETKQPELDEVILVSDSKRTVLPTTPAAAQHSVIEISGMYPVVTITCVGYLERLRHRARQSCIATPASHGPCFR